MRSYLCWAAVGLLAAFGTAAVLTIGLPFLIAAAVLAVLLAIRGIAGPGATGLGLGVAAIVGYVGWLNRGGPGAVCTTTSDGGGSCLDAWNPWPFFIIAAALAVASIIGYVALSRRTERE